MPLSRLHPSSQDEEPAAKRQRTETDGEDEGEDGEEDEEGEDEGIAAPYPYNPLGTSQVQYRHLAVHSIPAPHSTSEQEPLNLHLAQGGRIAASVGGRGCRGGCTDRPA